MSRKVHAARFSTIFFHTAQTAELKAGLPLGFFAREAGANMLLDLLLDVELQLVIELVFDDITAEKRTKPKKEITEHGILLCGAKHLGHRSRQFLPGVGFHFELLTPIL